MRKKLATVTAHRELTVSSPWAHREFTVTKMVPASRDWAVTWAVIELWPSRDWAVIIGPGAVTTVVTVNSRWDYGDNFFLMGNYLVL